MSPNRRQALAAAALLLALGAAACGDQEPKADPAAVDKHLNKIIADEEAQKNRLVEEARDREDVRENEMEQRSENAREAE
jgi:hypothetical protein